MSHSEPIETLPIQIIADIEPDLLASLENIPSKRWLVPVPPNSERPSKAMVVLVHQTAIAVVLRGFKVGQNLQSTCAKNQVGLAKQVPCRSSNRGCQRPPISGSPCACPS